MFRRRQRLHSLGFLQLGQAEIENLGPSVVGDKNIRGFNVAMDNTFFVCCIQPFSRLNCYVDDVSS